jgi:hypothetical protein
VTSICGPKTAKLPSNLPVKSSTKMLYEFCSEPTPTQTHLTKTFKRLLPNTEILKFHFSKFWTLSFFRHYADHVDVDVAECRREIESSDRVPGVLQWGVEDREEVMKRLKNSMTLMEIARRGLSARFRADTYDWLCQCGPEYVPAKTPPIPQIRHQRMLKNENN